MANNTNPMTILDPSQRPAHVKAQMAAGTSNIVVRSQVNTLTFPGKVFTVTLNGERKPQMRVNQETGEEELIQAIDVIVIAYNENRGRSYYGDQPFDPAQRRAPVCWSNDGVTSSPNGSERQSEKCNVCPQAIKGSRQTDQGKAATACSQHRNLAIIPSRKDLSTAPLLKLQIPQTSDWDGLNKDAQAKGMFAWSNYLSHLKMHQVPFTYSLTTKIRFDNTKNYPKLLFSTGRWLTEDETATCAEIAASNNLDDLLKTDFSGFGGTARPPGITAADEEEDDVTPTKWVDTAATTPKQATVAITAATHKAAVVEEDEPKSAPTPAPASAPTKTKTATQKKIEAAAAAAAARKAAALVEDDEEEEPVVAATANRASAPVAAPATATPPALDKILTDWDE